MYHRRADALRTTMHFGPRWSRWYPANVSDWTMAATTDMSAYLTAKNQDGLTSLMVRLAMAGHNEGEIAALAVRLLAKQDHNVQEWWMGSCNCTGHSN